MLNTIINSMKLLSNLDILVSIIFGLITHFILDYMNILELILVITSGIITAYILYYMNILEIILRIIISFGLGYIYRDITKEKPLDKTDELVFMLFNNIERGERKNSTRR